jgi:hypothetical protein
MEISATRSQFLEQKLGVENMLQVIRDQDDIENQGPEVMNV